jgi:predicted DNA-binding protein (MmcQ/YjbR family)
VKNLRDTFRDMTPDEMREASREAEIDSMTKNDAPIEYLTPAEFFRRMRVIRSTLEKFGFKKESGVWTYSAPIASGALICTLTVNASGAVKETTTDAATGDEYVQHHVVGASGKFVGSVRCEIMALMKRVADSCFERDVFKTDLARGIIAFAESEWGEKPEFLWKNFPDYAVLRRKDTDKLYALVARLTADKVGGSKKDIIEVVNLRRTEGMDGSRFLPAYHMNKKTWTTVILDGTIDANKLLRFLTVSRENAR